MYAGVRVGGVWWLPTCFRWGYGWDYPQTGPPGTGYGYHPQVGVTTGRDRNHSVPVLIELKSGKEV